jgi:hypothetical protein
VNPIIRAKQRLLVSPSLLSISLGHLPGMEIKSIVGARVGGLAATSLFWDQDGAYTFQGIAAVFQATSSNNADVTVIRINGLGGNLRPLTEDVTLTGQAPVNTVNSYVKITSISVVSGVHAGDIYIADNDTYTAGVPDTASKIRAQMLIGVNTANGIPILLQATSSDNADVTVIRINGLGMDLLPLTENIILTGQAPINTVEEYFRIQSIEVVSGTHAGNIYIADNDTCTLGVPDTQTKIRAMMAIGFDSSRMGLYTVPAGKAVLVTEIVLSPPAGGSANCSLLASAVGSPLTLRDKLMANLIEVGRQNAVPIPFPSGTDITLVGDSAGDTSVVMKFIEVDNNYLGYLG